MITQRTKILNIKEIENKLNGNVIYVTEAGSKLYGTNSSVSDTDYIGLFIPNKRDVLLKKDKLFYKSETNKDRNTSEDVDIVIYSIYHFIDKLKVGETGSIDLLFSMFRKDTQILNKTEFTSLFTDNYKKFLSKNIKAFTGYCMEQAKKYGIKGSRFKELEDFTNRINNMPEGKVKDYFLTLSEIIKGMKYKYISVVEKVEPNNNRYISVLGKLYQDTLQTEDFIKKVKSNLSQYGDRTKLSSKGTDLKALSHALRVISEVEELLKDNFITFPLKNAEEVKKVKYGHSDTKEVTKTLKEKLDTVDDLVKNSDLPLELNNDFLEDLKLKLLDFK